MCVLVCMKKQLMLIALLVWILLSIPLSSAELSKTVVENKYLVESDLTQMHITDTSFLRDTIFLIIGKISNPCIDETGSNKLLIFTAEEVLVIGLSYSYDGASSITQWIYQETVTLGWETNGPDFRGIITGSKIIGRQI